MPPRPLALPLRGFPLKILPSNPKEDEPKPLKAKDRCADLASPTWLSYLLLIQGFDPRNFLFSPPSLTVRQVKGQTFRNLGGEYPFFSTHGMDDIIASGDCEVIWAVYGVLRTPLTPLYLSPQAFCLIKCSTLTPAGNIIHGELSLYSASQNWFAVSKNIACRAFTAIPTIEAPILGIGSQMDHGYWILPSQSSAAPMCQSCQAFKIRSSARASIDPDE